MTNPKNQVCVRCDHEESFHRGETGGCIIQVGERYGHLCPCSKFTPDVNKVPPKVSKPTKDVRKLCECGHFEKDHEWECKQSAWCHCQKFTFQLPREKEKWEKEFEKQFGWQMGDIMYCIDKTGHKNRYSMKKMKSFIRQLLTEVLNDILIDLEMSKEDLLYIDSAKEKIKKFLKEAYVQR